MKVYLVAAGEYSDYHVVGLFSTPELAQAYIDTNNLPGVLSANFADMEEIEIDHLVGFVQREYWTASIQAKSGDWNWQSSGTEPASPLARGSVRTHTQAGPVSSFIATSFVSQEHANKLAAEARQAWLRKQTTSSTSSPESDPDV